MEQATPRQGRGAATLKKPRRKSIILNFNALTLPMIRLIREMIDDSLIMHFGIKLLPKKPFRLVCLPLDNGFPQPLEADL